MSKNIRDYIHMWLIATGLSIVASLTRDKIPLHITAMTESLYITIHIFNYILLYKYYKELNETSDK